MRIWRPPGSPRPLEAAAEPGGALVFRASRRRHPHPRRPRTWRKASAGPGTPGAGAGAPAAGRLLPARRAGFDLPLALRGTPFQLRVWAELLKIPYGRTISYGELARRLGDPNLTRAVGTANGANPVSIIVPCHRVIGTGRSLVGYGGGLENKKRLLDLERPAIERGLFD